MAGRIVVDDSTVPDKTVPDGGATVRAAGGGTDRGPGVEAFETVIASGAALPPDERVGLDDAAMILYTSGTTGNPKGRS